MMESRTKRAVEAQRVAAQERILAMDTAHLDPEKAQLHAMSASGFERKAKEALAMPVPAALVAGEALPMDTQTKQRRQIRDTLKTTSAIAVDASVDRTDLLLGQAVDVVALAIDAAHTANAANSIEKMLAHQMALAHAMAFKLGDKAMHMASKTDLKPVECVEATRLVNATARLMSAFQDGCATLQRLKSGGSQTVTVQHVHVGAGGQAMIGNVKTGAPAAGEEQ